MTSLGAIDKRVAPLVDLRVPGVSGSVVVAALVDRAGVAARGRSPDFGGIAGDLLGFVDYQQTRGSFSAFNSAEMSKS